VSELKSRVDNFVNVLCDFIRCSSPGKVCYMMAGDRCLVDSGTGHVGDIEDLEEDNRHDDGDVRLTR